MVGIASLDPSPKGEVAEATELPPRGTGLITGTARQGLERGMGKPLTEEERAERHRLVSEEAKRQFHNLVRNSFKFECALCETIAEKVCSPLKGKMDITACYEAFHDLSSEDREKVEKAVKTLKGLGVWDKAVEEIKTAWEKIKGKVGKSGQVQ